VKLIEFKQREGESIEAFNIRKTQITYVIERLQAKKYKESQGIDDEMESYNEGIDDALEEIYELCGDNNDS